MKIKLTFTLGLYFLGLLVILGTTQTIFAQPLAQQTNTRACAIPASGPWPPCATAGNASSANSPNNCTIPATGPWPPCATAGNASSASSPNNCTIPATGPWPPCATGDKPQAPTYTPPPNCIIPESGPWAPCATGQTASLPADGCIIPATGPWPECELLTVTINNFWAHQYHVAWRGNNANVNVVMLYETITTDNHSGHEKRTSNRVSRSLAGAAGGDLFALKPFSGRLFESQFITFQLQGAANKVLAQRVLPLVKPRKVAIVHQFEKIGTVNDQRILWNISPALDGSRVQLHIVRHPETPEILNEPLGPDQREELLDMPLVGARDIVGEYKSIELIVNGWVVGTLR